MDLHSLLPPVRDDCRALQWGPPLRLLERDSCFGRSRSREALTCALRGCDHFRWRPWPTPAADRPAPRISDIGVALVEHGARCDGGIGASVLPRAPGMVRVDRRRRRRGRGDDPGGGRGRERCRCGPARNSGLRLLGARQPPDGTDRRHERDAGDVLEMQRRWYGEPALGCYDAELRCALFATGLALAVGAFSYGAGAVCTSALRSTSERRAANSYSQRRHSSAWWFRQCCSGSP